MFSFFPTIDFRPILSTFVLFISMTTSTEGALNQTPPWKSPCGKTTIPPSFLASLGPILKQAVPIKRMLHNVIIELKETDEKVEAIQQYYVSCGLLYAYTIIVNFENLIPVSLSFKLTL